MLARTSRYLFVERRLLEAVSYTLIFSAFTGCVYSSSHSLLP